MEKDCLKIYSLFVLEIWMGVLKISNLVHAQDKALDKIFKFSIGVYEVHCGHMSLQRGHSL